MSLASRFAPQSPILRSDRPLSDDRRCAASRSSSTTARFARSPKTAKETSRTTSSAMAWAGSANNIAERDQYLGRPIINVTDEGHIITKNPLLAPYVVKITKMWRKLGAWFWLATQNIDDLPRAAEPMLNMIEWWICLSMPPDEVEKIARFRELSPAQKALMLSARKEAGKFTEGVILSKSMEVLFRAVPPSLYLALAQTEPEEKAGSTSLPITRGVIEALRDEPDQDLLARRLASEVALSSVLEKALLLQRTLLTGKKEPNVAANQLAVEAVNHESDTLDQEIRNLKTELELRRELANNSPMAIIQRHGTRAAGSRGIYEGDPVPDRLDRLQRGNPGGTP